MTTIMTGLSPKTGHHGTRAIRSSKRPSALQWLTDDRVTEAQRVWSRAYGRIISEDEAIEILMNVRRLAEVLFHPEEEQRES